MKGDANLVSSLLNVFSLSLPLSKFDPWRPCSSIVVQHPKTSRPPLVPSFTRSAIIARVPTRRDMPIWTRRTSTNYSFRCLLISPFRSLSRCHSFIIRICSIYYRFFFALIISYLISFSALSFPLSLAHTTTLLL